MSVPTVPILSSWASSSGRIVWCRTLRKSSQSVHIGCHKKSSNWRDCWALPTIWGGSCPIRLRNRSTSKSSQIKRYIGLEPEPGRGLPKTEEHGQLLPSPGILQPIQRHSHICRCQHLWPRERVTAATWNWIETSSLYSSHTHGDWNETRSNQEKVPTKRMGMWEVPNVPDWPRVVHIMDRSVLSTLESVPCQRLLICGRDRGVSPGDDT